MPSSTPRPLIFSAFPFLSLFFFFLFPLPIPFFFSSFLLPLRSPDLSSSPYLSFLPSTPSLPTLLPSFLFLSSSFPPLHFSPFCLLPSLFRPFYPFSPPFLFLSSLFSRSPDLCPFPIPLSFLHPPFFPFSCPSPLFFFPYFSFSLSSSPVFPSSMSHLFFFFFFPPFLFCSCPFLLSLPSLFLSKNRCILSNHSLSIRSFLLALCVPLTIPSLRAPVNIFSFLFPSMSHLSCPRIMSSSLPLFFYSYPPFPYILFISSSESMRFLFVLLLSSLPPPLISSWSSFAVSIHNAFAPTLPLNHTNLNYVHSALLTPFLSTFFSAVSLVSSECHQTYSFLFLYPYSSCLYCADSLCT